MTSAILTSLRHALNPRRFLESNFLGTLPEGIFHNLTNLQTL